MSNPENPSSYASNATGAAAFALRKWEYQHKRGEQADPVEEAVRRGRMQAFASIIKILTGRALPRQLDEAWEVALSMPGGETVRRGN